MHNTAHQHQFGSITADGDICEKRLRLVRRCTVCGYTEMIGLQENIIRHSFSKRYITIKRPTCTSTGCASLKCMKCGQTKLVDLPISDHHYIRNNPFFEICNDCHHKRLTSGAKRLFLVSGTAALTGSLMLGTMSSFKGKMSAVSEHDISFPDFQFPSGAADTCIFTETYSIHSSQEAVPSLQPKTTEDTAEDFSEEYVSSMSSMPAPSPAADAHTFPPTAAAASAEQQNTLQTFPEAQACPSAADFETTDPKPAETVISPSVDDAIVVTDVAEIPAKTASSESSAESNASIQEDFSYLIGTLLNKNEILQLINAGAPVEIIMDSGEKRCANISVSGASPLADTALIPETNLYTVNIIFLENQQVIVLNPL